MPHQKELIEQVVLEPEDDLLVIGERLEGGVVPAIPVEDLVERRDAGGREVGAAGTDPLVAGGERRGSLVQDIRPRDEGARDAGSLHQDPRGIAVGDV
jgi:hypothetical protein